MTLMGTGGYIVLMAESPTANKKKGRRRRRSRAEVAKERGAGATSADVAGIKLTKAQVSKALGISQVTFQEYYRAHVPDELVNTSVRPHQYELTSFGHIVRGKIKEVADSYTHKEAEPKGDGNSLDKKREIQAKTAELDYEIKRGNYLKRETITEGLDRFVTTLRRYGDKVRKTGNTEMVELFNEMIEEAVDSAQIAVQQLEEAGEEDTAWAV